MKILTTGGTLGDPIDIEKYGTLSAKSRDKWVMSYRNWYRQQWAINYLKKRAKWLKPSTIRCPTK